MIKLNNVNKYFNKGKSNEIHVINNTSLELPEKGFVTLLGESGSGKTTLLNVIGGLDKATGEITFKDQILHKYQSNKWDNLRNKHIGFVFQNYYLLDNKTVYENIELVLKMIGETNLDTIKEKIEYVLTAVGMERFKHRYASDLSGGQKQRIALARALVKNPDVIIADEPTGNLDTNNSIEVMKIIKEISKEKLVVLVTHNNNLASHYSDRIITVVDGVVKDDVLNDHYIGELDYIDNNIYLKDLNQTKKGNIEIYSDVEIADLNLMLVKINNNYYLKTNDKNITIKNLNKESNIEIIDDKKANVVKKFTKDTTFKIEHLESSDYDSKKGYYSFKDSFIEALRKITNLTKRGKLQIISLIALAIMFTFGIVMLYSALFVDSSSIHQDEEIYLIKKDGQDLSFLQSDNYYVYQTNLVSLDFIQGHFKTSIYGFKVAPANIIGRSDLALDEAIFDEHIISKDYANYNTIKNFGITKTNHLINQKIAISGTSLNLKVVELINSNTHSVYVNNDLILINQLDSYLIDVVTSIMPMRIYESNNVVAATISPILDASSEFNVYINETYKDNHQVINQISQFYNIYFYSDDGTNNAYVKASDIKNYVIDKSWNNELIVYSKNGTFPDNVKVTSLYDSELKEMKLVHAAKLATALFQTISTIVIAILIFFFLVRSSLTSRIKEISVLRSLGLNKRSVVKLYAIEYLLLTTFTSLVGVIVGSLVINQISNSLIGQFFSLRIDWISFATTVALVYISNVGVGLIPVLLKLRQTPAELLTNYDM